MRTRSLHAVILFLLVFPLTFCGGGGSSTVTPIVLQSVTISPGTVTLAVGQTQQFTATAHYSDGSAQNVTSSATWSASPSGAVSFASPGSAKALVAGDVTVQATYSGKSDSRLFTIGPAIVASITITPAAPAMVLGDHQQLTATASYSDGTNVDVTALATWSSSNAAAASVSSITGFGGIVTARGGGNATVQAAYSGASNTVSVGVTVPATRYLFAANHDATISGFYANGSDTLTANGYLYTGSSPNMPGTTVMYADKYLYATDAHMNLVRAYAIDATGHLQLLIGSRPTGAFPTSAAVAGAGKYLYVANYLENSISGFTIAADGSLTNFLGGIQFIPAAKLAADPLGKFLYVADGTNLGAYTIGADGLLTPANALVTGGHGGAGVLVDPSGQFVFTADSGTFTLSTFTASPSGKLTLSGSPVALPGAPLYVALDPAGTMLYLIENLAPGVSSLNSFRVDSTTGSLMPAGAYPLSGNPAGVTADPSGHFVYVSMMSNDILTLMIDRSTGDFNLLQTMRGRGGPFSITATKGSAYVSVAPKYVYSYGATESAVRGFSMNASTGALSALSGSPFASAGTGISLAMHPNGSYLYAGAYWSNKISAFSVSNSTGALTPFGSSPAAVTSGPYQMAIEPSGRFLYASDDYNAIHAFNINASGALTQRSDVYSDSSTYGPGSIAIDPAGRVVYIANESGSSLTGFLLDGATGDWDEIGSDIPLGAPVGNYPRAITFDPTGRYLFVAMQCAYWATSCMSKALLGYAVNADGTLTALADSPFAVGSSPMSVAVDGTGRFVYAASDGVYGLTLDAASGTLTPMSSSFGPGGYAWLYPEAGGNYLMRGDDTGMTAYSIGASSGALTPTSSVSAPSAWSCAVSYDMH